ncbi:MAG TPA: hypothetical protein VH595_23475 [Verrucomicrobiae bacterium]|jgi:hypothetical protein|nr:hypothetical protein [Verrucomicrobiae bacterium]
MNNRADEDDLLAAMLAEGSPPDFRAALLGQTLRSARRRRRVRQARRVGGVLIALLLTAIVVKHKLSKPSVILPLVAKQEAPVNYNLVRTQPLSANEVTTTRPFSGMQLLSSVSAVAEVATANGGYRQIDDHELLALLSGRPAVLIRTGPHSEELVFASPEDRKSVLAN